MHVHFGQLTASLTQKGNGLGDSDVEGRAGPQRPSASWPFSLCPLHPQPRDSGLYPFDLIHNNKRQWYAETVPIGQVDWGPDTYFTRTRVP